MTDAPETRYPRSADGTNLAYQLSGDGPLDLVWMGGGPLDLVTDNPGFIRVRRRLSSFSRTVWWDGRGMGASEGDLRDLRIEGIADADLAAVLDAVGFERPAMVAGGESGPPTIRFSVTRPERISALVLVNSFAYYVQEDDYRWGIPAEGLDSFVAAIREKWGTAAAVEVLAPSRVGDERFRAWQSRSMRFTWRPRPDG